MAQVSSDGAPDNEPIRIKEMSSEKPGKRTSPRRSAGQDDSMDMDTSPARGTRSHSPAVGSPAPSETSSIDPLAMSPINTRPKRASRAGPSRLSVASNGEAAPKPKPKKAKLAPGEKLPVSELSAAALGKLTNNNTKRNEARVAELELRFVLLDIPRPPSPSSKIRTVAQKESSEAEMARQRRARNRSIMRGEPMADDPLDPDNRLLKHPRAPGDEEEYHTPKKVRLAMMENEARENHSNSGERIADSVPILGEVEDEERRRKGKGKGKRGSPPTSSNSASPPPSKRPKYVRWDKVLASDEPSVERSESGDSLEGRTLRSALSNKAVSDLISHSLDEAQDASPPLLFS